MSYYPQQGQPPNQYPQQPPPQQGYGQPPPPQGYPQQPGYNQQPQQYPYAANHQHHHSGSFSPPPPQSLQPGYGGHPAPGYGAPPPQQGYAAPPPQQHGYAAPQQAYPQQGGYPAPQGYAPPPQGYPPPQNRSPSLGYGHPPPQQGHSPQPGYGHPPPHGGVITPNPPSIGYTKGQTAPVDRISDAEALRKAMKGLGTNEKEVIRAMANQDPLEMETLLQTYNNRFGRDLYKDLHSETSGNFRKGLLAIAEGPLKHDVATLHDALKGIGTKESHVIDVLVGRSNADVNAIKAEYQLVHRASLEAEIKSDFKGSERDMFLMILSARRTEDAVPVTPHEVDNDVAHLITSGNHKNASAFYQVLCARSDMQIRGIATTFAQRSPKPLSTVISTAFHGYMKDALLLALDRAMDRASADAIQIEQSMSGMGIKDELLVNRIVRAHWNKVHRSQVRIAFHSKYNKQLLDYLKHELSGHYERLMVTMMD